MAHCTVAPYGLDFLYSIDGKPSHITRTLRDGRQLKHHTVSVKGTVANPMTRAELADKSLDLMAPILGKRRTLSLIDAVWNLEKVKNVRSLRALLSAS